MATLSDFLVTNVVRPASGAGSSPKLSRFSSVILTRLEHAAELRNNEGAVFQCFVGNFWPEPLKDANREPIRDPRSKSESKELHQTRAHPQVRA